ncbi:hypothetical protein [Polynucleobacter necessarius]|uniref:hypothetical protein n=1 Tax=Polynucleobacter necessarius TaxID=576610 RepID=UPI001E2E3553|nr:hypothetical protein [Polynucleobacter necessarius]
MHNLLASNHLPSQPAMAGQVVPVRELHAEHRPQIFGHLLQLADKDRRLRFGTQTPDEVIHHYVDGIDFDQDAVFGVFDTDLKLIGLAHLAYLPAIKGQHGQQSSECQYCPRAAPRDLEALYYNAP